MKQRFFKERVMNRFIRWSLVPFMLLYLSSCGYNVIKKNEETVMRAWTNVEASLHRRADLIPDLIEVLHIITPKKEQACYDVIQARTKSLMIQFTANDLKNPEAVDRMIQTQNELSSALERLMNAVENSPEVKDNGIYIQIKNKIRGTENRMNVSCLQYNNAVTMLNQSLETFPYNMTNKIFFHLKGMKRIRLNMFNDPKV